LATLSDEEADKAWDKARAVVPEREKAEKQRREAVSEAKREKRELEEKKSEKKKTKSEHSQEEFKAVEVARTPEELDELLAGLNEKLRKDVLRNQITQLREVHGVSRNILPLSRKGKRFGEKEMETHLRSFLESGDPLADDAPERQPVPKKKQRGRPKNKQSAKSKPKGDEMDWSSQRDDD